MKIDQNIIETLAKGRVENNLYYLPPGQLDRKIYIKVNDVLTSIGLVWNKKQKAHISDTDIEEKLEELINTGEYNSIKEKIKTLQYFPTPVNIVKQMVELAELNEKSSVLETSAGQGAILKGIKDFNKSIWYTAFEIDEGNCKVLRDNNFVVNCEDFLKFDKNLPVPVNRVIQNPPFHIKGRAQCDIDFILHAWKFLELGGILVSICSPSPFFRSNKKSEQFREFLENNNAEIIDLPEKAFAESGTSIRTKLIKIKKS